jgi:hypothetical protein
MFVLAVSLVLSGASLAVISGLCSVAYYRLLMEYKFRYLDYDNVHGLDSLVSQKLRPKPNPIVSYFTNPSFFILLDERPEWLPPDSVGEVYRQKSERYAYISLIGIPVSFIGVLLIFFYPM